MLPCFPGSGLLPKILQNEKREKGKAPGEMVSDWVPSFRRGLSKRKAKKMPPVSTISELR